MKITEKNYINELQRKNEDALEFVVKKHGGLLKAVIKRILYNYPEDAEECLYDVILKIWNNIDTYNNVNRFESWIAAIAQYAALNRLRDLKRLEPLDDIDEIQVADVNAITENELFNSFFAELISCLNEEDKIIFTKVFWNGDSVDKVSRELEKNQNTIYKRISRGKLRIIKHNPEYFK